MCDGDRGDWVGWVVVISIFGHLSSGIRGTRSQITIPVRRDRPGITYSVTNIPCLGWRGMGVDNKDMR